MLLGKVKEKLEAKRPWGDHEHPLICDDGDTQLRAVEIGLRTHERAGTIPSERSSGGGGTAYHLHLHLDGLEGPQPVVVETEKVER